eukprot:5509794-Pleurochrysis_carterae.AAC.4
MDEQSILSKGSYCHIGTSSLGADADNLLTDQKFLKRALQWLVTDHKEADDSSSSGAAHAAIGAVRHIARCS